MQNIVVNLYGGPGSGKSTLAAALVGALKMEGHSAELVTEYVKEWAWEGRTPRPGDQTYIAAKQMRAERRLLGKAGIIVTDSPVMLGQFYEAKYDPYTPAVPAMLAKHGEQLVFAGYQSQHVYVHRDAPYRQDGRFETEAEAREIDIEIWDMLVVQLGEVPISVCSTDIGLQHLKELVTA